MCVNFECSEQMANRTVQPRLISCVVYFSSRASQFRVYLFFSIRLFIKFLHFHTGLDVSNLSRTRRAQRRNTCESNSTLTSNNGIEWNKIKGGAYESGAERSGVGRLPARDCHHSHSHQLRAARVAQRSASSVAAVALHCTTALATDWLRSPLQWCFENRVTRAFDSTRRDSNNWSRGTRRDETRRERHRTMATNLCTSIISLRCAAFSSPQVSLNVPCGLPSVQRDATQHEDNRVGIVCQPVAALVINSTNN